MCLVSTRFVEGQILFIFAKFVKLPNNEWKPWKSYLMLSNRSGSYYLNIFATGHSVSGTIRTTWMIAPLGSNRLEKITLTLGIKLRTWREPEKACQALLLSEYQNPQKAATCFGLWPIWFRLLGREDNFPKSTGSIESAQRTPAVRPNDRSSPRRILINLFHFQNKTKNGLACEEKRTTTKSYNENYVLICPDYSADAGWWDVGPSTRSNFSSALQHWLAANKLLLNKTISPTEFWYSPKSSIQV